MSTLALELTDLRKSFGPTEIIRGLNLQVQQGHRHAVIGPNGAGKSTLFHLISGRFPLTFPDMTARWWRGWAARGPRRGSGSSKVF